MTQNRTLRIPGGQFFCSAFLRDQSSDLLVRHINRVRAATYATMQAHPFTIDAIVVLPSAIHTVWTLPGGDGDLDMRWHLLRSLFARGLAGPGTRTDDIWHSHIAEQLVKDWREFEQVRARIYAAPVKAGLVDRASAWQHSSLHRDSDLGSWAMPAA